MNPADMDPRRVETLRAIMKALRTPKTGCPWDLEQSFETIAPYTIEQQPLEKALSCSTGPWLLGFLLRISLNLFASIQAEP